MASTATRGYNVYTGSMSPSSLLYASSQLYTHTLGTLPSAPYRAAMYACLGLSAVIFVIHGILLHGWPLQNQRMSLDWMAVMATFNLSGATVYAARVCVSSSCPRAMSDHFFADRRETLSLHV